MVVRVVQALRFMNIRAPITVNELTLDLNEEQQYREESVQHPEQLGHSSETLDCPVFELDSI